MELRQIRFFIHVASLRSFTKAARVLNVAQPALSRHIQALEDELRTKLLFRSTRGVVPTDAGVALMRMGESVLAYVEQMREEVSRAADIPSGNVIVGMPQSIAPALAPLLMEACRARLPNVALRVTEGLSVFLEEWLNVAKIDVALMTDPGKILTLHTSLLAREHMVLVGGAGSMPANGNAITLADIATLPLVIAYGFRQLIDRWIEPRGIKFDYVMELDSITIIKEMIKRGAWLFDPALCDSACRGAERRSQRDSHRRSDDHTRFRSCSERAAAHVGGGQGRARAYRRKTRGN